MGGNAAAARRRRVSPSTNHGRCRCVLLLCVYHLVVLSGAAAAAAAPLRWLLLGLAGLLPPATCIARCLFDVCLHYLLLHALGEIRFFAASGGRTTPRGALPSPERRCYAPPDGTLTIQQQQPARCHHCAACWRSAGCRLLRPLRTTAWVRRRPSSTQSAGSLPLEELGAGPS